MNKKSLLQKELEIAGYDTIEYSGRSMYGKKCLAFEARSQLEAIRMLLTIAFDAPRSYVGHLKRSMSLLQMDQLGKGVVVYFEDVPFCAEEPSQPTEDETTDVP